MFPVPRWRRWSIRKSWPAGASGGRLNERIGGELNGRAAPCRVLEQAGDLGAFVDGERAEAARVLEQQRAAVVEANQALAAAGRMRQSGMT